MKVNSLTLTNLFSHTSTRVELPERGLVLVTGPNGSGKSSLAECVAVACWGKTLRGATPWVDGAKCEAKVEADDLAVRRTRNGKGSPALSWRAGTAEQKFPTTTKAQAALEHTIGPFDVWRRSHVFSSSDAAHFTLATDGERKRLLEALLGLDRFDAALASCRGDLRAAESTALAKYAELSRLETQLSGQMQREEDAVTALAKLGPKPTGQLDLVDSVDLRTAESEVRQCGADIEDARAQANEQVEASAAAGAEVRSWHRRLLDIELGQCPTCTQSIPGDLAERLFYESQASEGEAKRLREEVDAAKALAGEAVAELAEERAVFRERAEALRRKRDLQLATKAERDRYVELRKQHELTKAQASLCVSALKKDIKHAAKAKSDLDANTATLRATESVLGLRGVRAHVLGSALGGLETVANAWLGRLRCDDLRVRLLPYSEKKTGGVADAISLEVDGAGGGYGYKASSGGERRRVDVALLLAMAEVAAASRGDRGIPGTLWFDEVFDCLDEEGTEAVVSALDDLAHDRAVVIVSHSAGLVGRLPHARRLRVEEGRIV